MIDKNLKFGDHSEAILIGYMAVLTSKDPHGYTAIIHNSKPVATKKAAELILDQWEQQGLYISRVDSTIQGKVIDLYSKG